MWPPVVRNNAFSPRTTFQLQSTSCHTVEYTSGIKQKMAVKTVTLQHVPQWPHTTMKPLFWRYFSGD